MASKNVRNILRVPGRLVKSPTSLATAFPHGGTELGVVRDMVFKPGIKTTEIVAEEFGSTPIQSTYVGERAVFACVLRSYDNDMLSTVFPNTSAGSSTGDQIVNADVNTGNRAGYNWSGSACALLFSPKAVDRHPHILIYNAHPLVEETAALQMSIGEEFGLAVMFLAVPDSTGRLYTIGKRDDLSI